MAFVRCDMESIKQNKEQTFLATIEVVVCNLGAPC